jgi:hypothetical protein
VAHAVLAVAHECTRAGAQPLLFAYPTPSTYREMFSKSFFLESSVRKATPIETHSKRFWRSMLRRIAEQRGVPAKERSSSGLEEEV